MKICKNCQKNKPMNEFYKHKGYKDKHRNECKECHKLLTKKYQIDNPNKHHKYNSKWWRSLSEKEKRSIKPWNKKNPSAYRKWYLKHYYGISEEIYQQMLERQSNKCAICNRERKLQVDHNHKSKKVRGLLCSDCNTTLGKVNDDPLMLEKMIAYIKQDGSW